MDSPIMFQAQAFSNHFNMQPSDVKGSANAAVEVNKRYLWMKIYSAFKFTLPEDWKLNWFRFWLFRYGSIAGIYTKDYGWIAYPYSITKLGLYYNPSEIEVIPNFTTKTYHGVIGLNAEVINLTDDYFGLDDLVTRYATKLAQIDKDIDINLMNCNMSLLAEVDDKKTGDAIKEAYGLATEGKPLVVLNKNLLNGQKLQTMFPNVRNTYIVDMLLTARRTIVNEFLTEIGIKNANYDKKERLNSQEVEANTDETSAIISVIFENLKKSFDKLNRLSGLGLKVELRYDYQSDEEGGIAEWEE